MKKISTLVLGLSLLTSSAIAAQNHSHHDHSAHMNHSQSNTKNTSAYFKETNIDNYKVSLSSQKPLVNGLNKISIAIEKDGKNITDVLVKIKFFMPEMPGMPYMEYEADGTLEDDKFKCDVSFSMGGTWQYQLKFKTPDGKVHKTRGSVNI